MIGHSRQGQQGRHLWQFASNQRGFSLLEFILYFAVISVALTAAVGFSIEFVTTQARGQAYREIGRDGRYAVERLAVEMREASDINLGSSTLGVDPSVISLSMANPADDPTIFQVTDGVLEVSRGGGAFTPVISSLSRVNSFVVRDVSIASRSRVYRVELRLNHIDTALGDITSLLEITSRIRKGQGHP